MSDFAIPDEETLESLCCYIESYDTYFTKAKETLGDIIPQISVLRANYKRNEVKINLCN